MVIHNIYIFANGTCLYYEHWNRPFNPLGDSPDQDYKLMFGLLFSLKVRTHRITIN